MTTDATLDMPDLPVLADWVKATEVAEELGVSRQRVNKMIQQREFETAHVLGKADGRPIYVVHRKEVDKVREAREGKRGD